MLTLQTARARRDAVVRWLRPLAPLVLLVVVWAAVNARPTPGTSGRGLAVSLTLAAFVIGGLGALATLRRPAPIQVGFIALVLVSSALLVWLQPDGAGLAGIFVGVALLAPLLRGHLSVPVIVIAVVLLGVIVAAGSHGSLASALLNAIMIGAFYGLLFLSIRLTEANQLAERLVVELEESRAAQARAAGLAERQRLAREMHDVLAHSLSGLLLQLEGARMLAAEDPADPRLRHAIGRAHTLGRTGLDEARRAIGMLRDDELPGPERLPSLTAQFEQDRGIPCQLTITGRAYGLGSEARLTVYRVAQEALTNITRHAHPDRVELRLEYAPATTRLTVEDFGNDGAVVAADGAGYGLTGMRERAELIGGTLTTAPTPTGFRVELEVPGEGVVA
jgi:signal transduction histidine kinase